MINKEIFTLAFLAKTRIDRTLNEEIQVHSKVQQGIHYFQVITQNISNLPKNIENELQRFIKILVLGASWLRPQVEEQTIHVKIKDYLFPKFTRKSSTSMFTIIGYNNL